MKPIVAALAVVLASVVVSAADVSGTWNVDGDVVGNPVKFACVLEGTIEVGGAFGTFTAKKQ